MYEEFKLLQGLGIQSLRCGGLAGFGLWLKCLSQTDLFTFLKELEIEEWWKSSQCFEGSLEKSK